MNWDELIPCFVLDVWSLTLDGPTELIYDYMDNLDMGGTQTCRHSSTQTFWFNFHFEIDQYQMIVQSKYVPLKYPIYVKFLFYW